MQGFPQHVTRVRIRKNNAKDVEPTGAGILISPSHVITCAHVIVKTSEVAAIGKGVLRCDNLVSRLLNEEIIEEKENDNNTSDNVYFFNPSFDEAELMECLKQKQITQKDLVLKVWRNLQKQKPSVYLDFPALIKNPDSDPLKATVVKWWPKKNEESNIKPDDIAVLKLKDEQRLPYKAEPARFISFEEWAFSEREVTVCGFPEGKRDGETINGILKDVTTPKRFQLNHNLGESPITYGYSGAAVWDKKKYAVIGMTVSFRKLEKDENSIKSDKDKSALMIPVSILIKAWPPLKEQMIQVGKLKGMPSFKKMHPHVVKLKEFYESK